MDRTCATCRHGERLGPDHPYVRCRRNPPSYGTEHPFDKQGKVRWPLTLSTDWCGEHQPKEDCGYDGEVDDGRTAIRARAKEG